MPGVKRTFFADQILDPERMFVDLDARGVVGAVNRRERPGRDPHRLPTERAFPPATRVVSGDFHQRLPGVVPRQAVDGILLQRTLAGPVLARTNAAGTDPAYAPETIATGRPDVVHLAVDLPTRCARSTQTALVMTTSASIRPPVF